MNNYPQVSVIMPTYNGAAFIGDSIKAVLNQTFKGFELIIINDASFDNTKGVVEGFNDSRIVYLEDKVNRGTSYARNQGLKMARSLKYIAYCDHDDIYYPQHIEGLFNFLEKYKDTGLAYTNYAVAENGRIKHMPSRPFSKRKLEQGVIFLPCCVMHRRECINRVGMFSNHIAVQKHAAEDWDFWLRISDHYKIGYFNKVSVEKTKHQNNRSRGISFFYSYKYIFKKRFQKHLRKSHNNAADYIRTIFPAITEKLLLADAGQNEIIKLGDFFYRHIQNFYTLSIFGICYFSAKDYKQAEKWLAEALYCQRHDNTTKEYINRIKFFLARTLLFLGDYVKAEELCNDILRYRQNNSDCLRLFVNSLAQQGRLRGYRKLTKAYKRGIFDKAIIDYRKAKDFTLRKN